jgi:hypothetical protein
VPTGQQLLVFLQTLDIGFQPLGNDIKGLSLSLYEVIKGLFEPLLFHTVHSVSPLMLYLILLARSAPLGCRRSAERGTETQTGLWALRKICRPSLPQPSEVIHVIGDKGSFWISASPVNDATAGWARLTQGGF